MIKKPIFDNEQYLKEQAAEIRQRIKMFGNKLYLEFGGKLLFDYHAARVLPGYDPNIKIRLLQELKDQAEVLICIYAGDIEIGALPIGRHHRRIDEIRGPNSGCLAIGMANRNPGIGQEIQGHNSSYQEGVC